MSPACAGMIPEPVAYRIGLKREPRMRGDDPKSNSEVSVQKR